MAPPSQMHRIATPQYEPVHSSRSNCRRRVAHKHRQRSAVSIGAEQRATTLVNSPGPRVRMSPIRRFRRGIGLDTRIGRHSYPTSAMTNEVRATRRQAPQCGTRHGAPPQTRGSSLHRALCESCHDLLVQECVKRQGAEDTYRYTRKHRAVVDCAILPREVQQPHLNGS